MILLNYMKIKITAEDIAYGVRGSCSLCPVVHAVNRAFNCEGANIGPFVIFLSQRRQWETPSIVRSFIMRFDAGLPVEPFEFELS